jgi:hypothetical protein
MRTPSGRTRGDRAIVLVEAIVAVGMLSMLIVAFAALAGSEARLSRELYFRAVAMQIVDGEMETLVAGERRAWPAGRHEYPVDAEAVKSLPPGRFVLTVAPKTLRLEWRPEGAGSPVAREVTLR